MRVLILGCGPAGLMAAQAVERHGGEPVIMSKKEKSFIGGAQYLHEPIPGITSEEPEGLVYVVKIGTQEGYAQKVYGNPHVPVSWTRYTGGAHSAWDIRKAYDRLWEKFESRIIHMELNPSMLDHILTVDSFDHVFSAVPAPVLCRHKLDQDTGGWKHVFNKQKVIIHPEIDEEFCIDYVDTGANFILYNGLEHVDWYRASRIFDVSGGTEYPLGAIVAGAKPVNKPLTTNCNCHNNIVRLGRYGKWNKNLLSHHGYEEAERKVTRSAVH